MPRIPRYSSQGSLSGRGGEAVVDHPEYLTVGIKTGMGEVMSRAGEKAMDITTDYLQKKEHARRVVEASQLETALMTDKANFLDSLEKRSDYHNIEKDTDAFINSNLPKYRSMVQNEAQWKMYEGKVKLRMAELGIKARAIADKKMFDDWEMKWDMETTPAYMREYVNTGNPAIIEEYEGVTRALISVGSVNAEKGTRAMKGFRSQGDLKRAVAFIDKNGLSAWNSLSAEKRLEMFPFMEDSGWSKINSVVKSLQSEQRRVAKEALDKNENTATLIATGDTFKLESGAVIKLDPFTKDRMLRDMVEQGAITDNLYLRLKPYYQEKGGKLSAGSAGKKAKKPNIKPMYRKNADGTIEYSNVDVNDPDAVGTMAVDGWSRTVPKEKKSSSDRFMEALNGTKKQGAGVAKKDDPLGLRK